MQPEVLFRAQRGDRLAQRDVLVFVGPRLAALVRRLGLKGEREDLLQALFAFVLEVLPKFDPKGSAQLTTWLHTVATRWLLMQHRKSRPDEVELDDALPSTAPDAADYAQSRSLEAALEAALVRLPDQQRRAFVLLQLEHLSLEEAAEAEAVPVGTMKSRLHRARAALAADLGGLLDRKEVTP